MRRTIPQSLALALMALLVASVAGCSGSSKTADDQPSPSPSAPSEGAIISQIRAFPSIDDCKYLFAAANIDESDQRIHELVNKGGSFFLKPGEHVRVVDTDPDSLFVEVHTDAGESGCVSQDYIKFKTDTQSASSPAADSVDVQVTPDASKYPLDSTIQNGDQGLAQLLYGDAAQAGQLGKDAIPTFPTKAAYDKWYKSDEDESCDPHCLRIVYDAMKAANQIEPVPIGTKVTVLKMMDDPKAPAYPICRIKVKGEERLVVCVALPRLP